MAGSGHRAGIAKMAHPREAGRGADVVSCSSTKLSARRSEMHAAKDDVPVAEEGGGYEAALRSGTATPSLSRRFRPARTSARSFTVYLRCVPLPELGVLA